MTVEPVTKRLDNANKCILQQMIRRFGWLAIIEAAGDILTADAEKAIAAVKAGTGNF